MNGFRAALLVGGLLAVPPVSAAQNRIVISDSLAANADRLDVKMSAGWAGISKWRFGDYAVVSSKKGWTETSTGGDFFSTVTDSATTEKFSFVLTNKTADSARVNAARNMRVREDHRIALGHGWFLGEDKVLLESDNFTAFITSNRDTVHTWVLVIGATRGSEIDSTREAFLTNGVRRIALVPATSRARGIAVIMGPAFGYEFVEDGQAVGALQYYVGHVGPPHFVWMHKSLDARMKLVLAAAMTAILQVKNP